MISFRAVGLILWCLLLAGCGGPSLATVTGVVQCDGAPLKKGEIIFEAADADSTPESAQIKDGKYRVTIAPGKKIVRINASRGNGIVDPLMKTEGRESMIPTEFNVQSTLTADLKAGQQDGVNFEDTSIPATP